ncbi:Zn-dependent protease with chaperone function [Mycolicibacterium chubuense NBB4]|uniref:Zn-dependent protease with chaperone function n=1 Tax=Mycolicibacterium chubuense (strain NBB4) TaxID=710421 RepID=I4BHA0_MYCCN|nr:M56 family metallopeptidase [Mycolicibacterium chubuense]AFM16657.1 Zn-dependent protease with chaperone function [Mycolicibacterium chubuense NBB4]
MNAVTFLLTYAVALSWLAPAVLGSRLVTDTHPRLGVAAWLATLGTALGAWVCALAVVVFGAVHSLVTDTALTFCVQTLGITSHLMLPSSLATGLVVGLLVVTATVAVHTARRVILSLIGTRHCNREHAEAVRIVGRATEHGEVVELPADRPAAYCVSGAGRRAIVVTTGALQRLEKPELAAVLAHERAHLHGGHHHVIAVLNALAAALPRLPLMRAAAESVPILLEMCADDTAARTHGRGTLASSLIALSIGGRMRDGVLAAAGTAVLHRVVRLTRPPERKLHRTRTAALAVVVTAACTAPAIAFTLCGF